jgi:hypothetical protein
MAKPLEHHPGYVTRYDMWTGEPYRVPVSTPRSEEDKAAQQKYDSAAYMAPMQQFYEAGHDNNSPAFDPDTGSRLNMGNIK